MIVINLVLRECKICYKFKSLKEFYVRKTGFYSYCRNCSKLERKRRYPGYYAKNKEKFFAKAKYARRKKLGVTNELFKQMFINQNCKCAICGSLVPNGPDWCLDHDHETSIVRQILCGNCNKALGLFKDNPNWLRKAADYVELHKPCFKTSGTPLYKCVIKCNEHFK
jgi:hypothetical protein